MKIENSDFKNYLSQIIDSKPSSLYSEVAEEALDYHNPKSFFEDLLSHGCISGMVGKLVYYYDTHKFYDKYYQEIESLRDEYESSTGESVLQYVNGDLKNWLAWFAFEETARTILNEFEDS